MHKVNKKSLLLFISLTTLFIQYLTFQTKADENSDSFIMTDNIKRTYNFFIPEQNDKNEEFPLVIVLHGGGSRGKRMSNYTNFIPLAKKERFITVFPDAIDGNWNDGRKGINISSLKKNIDDIKFISELIEHFSKEVNVDKNAVYVTGISNGAMMAIRCACELSDKVAAIASVEGNLPKDLKCTSEKNISVLLMNGTKDPIMPWSGGDIKFGFQKRGKVYSAEETLDFWKKSNRCSDNPQYIQLPDIKDDGTTIYKKSYKLCESNSEVILYKIENGGHSWAGAFEYNIFQKWITGKTSYDINASEAIWDFFKNHKRN